MTQPGYSSYLKRDLQLYSRPSKIIQYTSGALMRWTLWLLMSLLFGCKSPQNSPYPDTWLNSNTLFSAFSASPKTLDPAKSYSADSALFIQQVYETPLQYDRLKHPYQLIPAAASTLPKIEYLNQKKQPVLPGEKIAFTRYTLSLRKDLQYGPQTFFDTP